MLKINYNDFGSEMVENRATMNQLDLDEMTKDERKTYLSICDEVAKTAYAYISTGDVDNFPAFRTALHALFTFVGTETRILTLDPYSVRFIPAVVPFKVFKSKEYKALEKDIRAMKRAIAWACEVSGIDPEKDGFLFPNANTIDDMMKTYYKKDNEESYNICVKFFANIVKGEDKLSLCHLKASLTAQQQALEAIASEPWQYYKDFKNPMLASNGKTILKHVPASIRKNIEDTMADLLSQRSLMTVAQLNKEEAQVVASKKQSKKDKAESANK